MQTLFTKYFQVCRIKINYDNILYFIYKFVDCPEFFLKLHYFFTLIHLLDFLKICLYFLRLATSQNKLHLSVSSYKYTLLYYHLPPDKCEIIWNSKKNGLNVKEPKLSSQFCHLRGTWLFLIQIITAPEFTLHCAPLFFPPWSHLIIIVTLWGITSPILNSHWGSENFRHKYAASHIVRLQRVKLHTSKLDIFKTYSHFTFKHL